MSQTHKPMSQHKDSATPTSRQIMGTDDPLAIGSVFTPTEYISDAHCNRHPPQPLYIIRQVAFEDWRQAVMEQGGIISADTERRARNAYFYEVSTD